MSAATTHSNAEVVREMYAVLDEGGREPADPIRAIELIDPDVEITESPELPGELSGRGYANLLRADRVLQDAFDDHRNELESVVELDDGRVFVLLRFIATGKSSGVPVEAQMAHLLTLREGRVHRWAMYGDRARAIRDAGIEAAG